MCERYESYRSYDMNDTWDTVHCIIQSVWLIICVLCTGISGDVQCEEGLRVVHFKLILLKSNCNLESLC